jgi:DNA anti-recombination protein RmuC
MPQELSYFRLSLLSFLRDSHPNLTTDTNLIASRGDAAAEAYSSAIKNGQSHDQASEEANEVLYSGLLFSSYRTVVQILWKEFGKEANPAVIEEAAVELLPELKEVFSKYELSDNFETTEEYDQLYTELTGAIQILLEDGI